MFRVPLDRTFPPLQEEGGSTSNQLPIDSTCLWKSPIGGKTSCLWKSPLRGQTSRLVGRPPIGGNQSPSSPKQKVQSRPALIAGTVKIIQAVVHPFHNSMENAEIQLNASASKKKHTSQSELITLTPSESQSILNISASADVKEATMQKRNETSKWDLKRLSRWSGKP